MIIIILEFILFSFFGWILDSLLRSVKVFRTEGAFRWASAGYFPIPFCPIYGFGGLAIMFSFKNFTFIDGVALVALTTFFLVAIEYFGGLFCEKILKVKLWDYTESRFDIHGYIDLEHSVYYLLITVLFYYYIYFWILKLENILNSIPEFLNLPGAIAFVLVVIWLVIKRNPENFLQFRTKVLNLTVNEYSDLMTNIKKLKSRRKKEKSMAEKIIDKYLKKSGAKLRDDD